MHVNQVRTERAYTLFSLVQDNRAVLLASLLETTRDVENEVALGSANDATIGIPVPLLIKSLGALLGNILSSVDGNLLTDVAGAARNIESELTETRKDLTCGLIVVPKLIWLAMTGMRNHLRARLGLAADNVKNEAVHAAHDEAVVIEELLKRIIRHRSTRSAHWSVPG